MPVAILLVVTLSAIAFGAGAAGAQDSEAFFDVEIIETNAPIEEGETLVVEVVVTNTGDESDSQQIHLKNFDVEIMDSVAHPPMTLDPGESERATLRWETDQGDAGVGKISVQSNDDYPRHTIEIEPSAFYDISISGTDSPVTAGQNLDVSVSVTNTGSVNGTTPVWLERSDDRLDETSVALDAGETKQVTLTWDSSVRDIGDWELLAGTDGSSKPVAVTLTEPEPETSSGGGGSSTPRYVVERYFAPINDTGVADVLEGDVDRVAFESDRVAGHVLVVDHLSDVPSGVPAMTNDVSLYRIRVANEEPNENATITLNLSNETVEDVRLERLVVAHWNGEEWVTLDTTAERTGDDVRLEAETSSLSLFAVTVEEAPADSGAEQAEQASDRQTETTTPTIRDDSPATTAEDSVEASDDGSSSDATGAQTTDVTDANTPLEIQGSQIPWSGLVVALALVGLFGVYYYNRG